MGYTVKRGVVLGLHGVKVKAMALSPLDRAMGEECVRSWLFELNVETRPSYTTNYRKWLLWLWRIPEWSGKMPSALLDFQEIAIGRERMRLPRLIVQYVQERGGTFKSMNCCASHIRSFFLHNSVEIPMHYWTPQPTRDAVQGKLEFEQVRDIILHADPRYTAIFLTMLQGMMDLERFKRFNQKYAMLLAKHLKEKSLDEPFRIDFPNGRKQNPHPFYTFIYHDAMVAWKNYFTVERGWPEREGEPLALTDKGTPPGKAAIRAVFRTLAERQHHRPETPKGEMSGVGPHEAFRDVVRSHMQTARKKGFDTLCAEFWMGHSIDPYNYNKFTQNEPEYVLENAQIAAKYLNIVSGKQEPEITEDKMIERFIASPRAEQIIEGMVDRLWEQKYRPQSRSEKPPAR